MIFPKLFEVFAILKVHHSIFITQSFFQINFNFLCSKKTKRFNYATFVGFICTAV